MPKTTKMHATTLVVISLMLGACQSTQSISTALPQSLQTINPPPKCMTIDEPYCLTNWWHVFDDKVLDELMRQVLRHNRELSVASLTLQKALINTQKSHNAKKITPTLQAGTSQQQRKDLATGITTQTTSFDVNLSASWEVDLWGKLRLQSTLSDWEKNAIQADRQAVYLTLSSNVVKEYFSLISANQKLADNQKALAFQQKQLAFLERQYAIGLIAKADLLPVQQSINTLKQSALSLRTQKSEVLNTLATLSHTPVSHLPDKLTRQVTLPKLPEAFSGLSADVITHRPDIQALLWRLSVSLEQVNLLKKTQYPTLVLTAGTSSQHANLLDLLKVPVLNWGIALNMPTLNPKEYRLNRQSTELDAQIATLNYEDTVHKALFDVQQKLIIWHNHKETRQMVIEANRLAKAQLDNQIKRHQIGLISTKELTESYETYRQSTNALTDNALNQAMSFVALYQAIGGGMYR